MGESSQVEQALAAARQEAFLAAKEQAAAVAREQVLAAARQEDLAHWEAVLTASRAAADRAERHIRRARLDAHLAAGVILILLVIGGLGLWHGSRQAAAAQAMADRMSATLTELSLAKQQVEASRLALEQARLEAQAAAIGRQEAVDQLDSLRRQLEKTQAGPRQATARR